MSDYSGREVGPINGNQDPFYFSSPIGQIKNQLLYHQITNFAYIEPYFKHLRPVATKFC